MNVAHGAASVQNSRIMLTGTQIRIGRELAGHSQTAFAKLIGVHRATVSQIEGLGDEVPASLATGTMMKIVAVLEEGGCTFTVPGPLSAGVNMNHPALSGGAGVRLKDTKGGEQ